MFRYDHGFQMSSAVTVPGVFFVTASGLPVFGCLPAWDPLTWNPKCTQPAGFSKNGGDIEDARLKMVITDGLKASVVEEILAESLYKLWYGHYSLAALKVLNRFFGNTHEGVAKLTKPACASWLTDARVPFISWDFFNAHALRLLPVSTRPKTLNLTAVRSEFLKDVGIVPPSESPVADGVAPLTSAATPARRGVSWADTDESKSSNEDLRAQVAVLENAIVGLKRKFPDASSLPQPGPAGGPSQPASAAETAGLASLLQSLGSAPASLAPTEGSASPISRVLAGLVTKLLEKVYIDMAMYSSSRLQRIELLGTARPRSSITFVNGGLSLSNDQESDVAIERSWFEYRSGFFFVVETMMTLPSRAMDAPAMLKFMAWAETECPVPPHLKLQYVELCGLRFKALPDWVAAATNDTPLLMRFCMTPGGAPSPPVADPSRRPRGPPAYPRAPAPVGGGGGRAPKGILRNAPPLAAGPARRSKFPPAGQWLSKTFPGDTCLSRVVPNRTCRAPAGTVCQFSHVCSRCPNADHLMTVCPLKD